jgi:hypothetical protein
MEPNVDSIRAISVARKELVQLTLVAVILAIGAGVTATGLALTVFPSVSFTIALGTFVIAAGLIGAFLASLQAMDETVIIKGVVFLDRETREPVLVNRYSLSEEFSRNIKALFAENKALSSIWSKNSLDNLHEIRPGEYTFEQTPSRKLAIEAIEYYVLHALSVHLTDYFNLTKDASEEDLHTFSRSDFPHVLLENHFIDLFCRPLEEREAFSNHGDDDPSQGRVVFAIGRNGELFDDFDFRLPKGAEVTRRSHGNISIKTNRFSLIIECDLGGQTIVEGGAKFAELYIGRSFIDINSFRCWIKLSVKFSPY